MIVTYLRSSSLATLDFCEMKYFLSYVLKMPDKNNKKAVRGTMFHRVMQSLADIKIALDTEQNIVEDEEMGKINVHNYTIEDLVNRSVDYYAKQFDEFKWTKADRDMILEWVNTALEYADGALDPRKQLVYASELYFDIELKQDWAKYSYVVNDQKLEGYLHLKGTVDLIVFHNDFGGFQVIDYKTGKRFDWAAEKQKTYADIMKDKQLLFYFFCLKQILPEDSNIFMSIYYVNDGGVFDVAFDNDDYKRAEKMIKRRFEYIKNVQIPRQLSPENVHWKCEKLCKYSEPYKDGNTSICKFFHSQIRKKGIGTVESQFVDLEQIHSYGSGGGRIDRK